MSLSEGLKVMNESKRSKSNKISDSTKLKYAIDFVEELSWLLESKNKIKLNEIPDILRNNINNSNDIKNTTKKYISVNPNIHYLIGVLPSLFQDTDIFQKNEDITNFAKEVLKVEVSRAGKRSRYELIGLIVCECTDLDDNTLETLVDALSKLTGNSEKRSQMAKEKSSVGFSWNEAVRKLAE